jgi:hypothetical protein
LASLFGSSASPTWQISIEAIRRKRRIVKVPMADPNCSGRAEARGPRLGLFSTV